MDLAVNIHVKYSSILKLLRYNASSPQIMLLILFHIIVCKKNLNQQELYSTASK